MRRRFCCLVTVHLAAFSVAGLIGLTACPSPDTRAAATSPPAVIAVAGTVLARNFRVLALLVLFSAASAGVFGLLALTANGYLVGFWIRSAVESGVPLWLWAFVPLELLAFAAAAAAATGASWSAMRWLCTGRADAEDVPAAAKVIGGSAAVLCVAALVEGVLIREAWGL